jgi:OOP family OmpA-OmpF porin
MRIMASDEYEEAPHRTLKVVVFLAVLVGGAYYYKTNGQKEEEVRVPPPIDPGPELVVSAEDVDLEEGVTETPGEALAALGVGLALENPAALMAQIAESLQAGEVAAAIRLIGKEGLAADQAELLAKLTRESRIKLRAQNPIQEVGELEINRRGRWALNLEDHERRIFFDLLRGPDRKWRVERVMVPEIGVQEGGVPRAVLVDSLGIADAFLQAVLRQDFESAKSFVAGDRVSDAKIAGLCIVFEEGHYRMRQKHPLRGLYNRETTAGFLANVEDREGGSPAQFGINLQREDPAAPWRVKEVNLDELLANYATKVAGGDVYYTPLVKNPNGGDTLVLYFDFDKKNLEEKSERQLGIVVLLLQLDPSKKINISGHTDGFGTEDYNRKLSGERAETVKTFLIGQGVPREQILTEALGKTRPRRPNTTRSGEDDPSGRRANRRTEIYLDF